MSASLLASLLVRDEKVDAARMAEAFQRQVIFGGTLDTSLLELGLVDAATLAEYLVRASGLPFLDELPPWSGGEPAFDVGTAEALVAVPLGRVKESQTVLLAEPSDEKLAAVAGQVDGALSAAVGLEVRVRQAIAERYGIELPRRYAKLARRLAEARVAVPYRIAARSPTPPPATREPVAAPPALHTEPPPAPTMEASAPVRPSRPERQLISAVEAFAEPPKLEELTAALGHAPTEARPPVAASPVVAPPERSSATLTPLTIDEGLDALERAADRDDVLTILCRAARSHFAFSVLYGVQGKVAKPRVALAEVLVGPETLATAAVDLGASTPLQVVAQTLAPFVGRLGDGDALGIALRALGRYAPVPGAVLPIALGGRVVALLLVENGGQPADADGLAALTRLCAGAAGSFRRIIEAGRSEQTEPRGSSGNRRRR